MSIYYEYKGKLTFADEKSAAEACERLLNDENTVFFTHGGKLQARAIRQNKTVTVGSKGFAGGELPEETESLLREIAQTAIRGKIYIEYEADYKEKYYISVAELKR